MWILIIVGLVFLLIYAPIGVPLIIIGLIAWAVGKLKESKGIPSSSEKKCPKCAEFIKAEALLCCFCGYEYPPVDVRVKEAREKWLNEDPDSHRTLTDSQLLERIHDYFSKRDYLKCKFYCERLIQGYPKSDYVFFAREKLSEMDKKII